MRRRQLSRWIVVGGLAASACSGASGAPLRDPAPLPEDRPIRLQGRLTVEYGHHGSRCAPEPLAEVEGRIVEVRDSTGHVLASARTGARATARWASMFCRALTRFEMQLPRRHRYEFIVRDLPGRSEPISFTELKTLGFECGLRILLSADGRKFVDLSCKPPTWVLTPHPDPNAIPM
jgi:hypothetical protein